MKQALNISLVLIFLLTACSVATTTPPAPIVYSHPLEPISTETLTPTPKETPIPPIEALPATRESISQFANALQNAGINITPEQILQQGLHIQSITGMDGKQNKIATTHLDPDPSKQREALEGNYPLMVKKEGGEWERATWRNSSVKGREIGTDVATRYYFRTNAGYREAMLANFNYIVTGGVIQGDLEVNIVGDNLTPEQIVGMYNWEKFDDLLQTAESNHVPITVQSLFGEFWEGNTPKWLKQMNNDQIKVWMDLHVKAISDRVKGSGVKVVGVTVYNEVIYGNETSDYVATRIGRDDAVTLGFALAEKYFSGAIPFALADNVAYGSDTANPNNAEAQVIFAMVKELREKGVKIDKVFDHGHLHAKDFKSEEDVMRYLKGVAVLVEQYRKIGVHFGLNELDFNIANTTPDQQALARKTVTGIVKLWNYGTLPDLIYWGISPVVGWMSASGDYPYGEHVPLMPFDQKDVESKPEPTLLYYEILKTLVDN